MQVRIGLPKTVGALPGEVERMGAPALVSAMSLWEDQERAEKGGAGGGYFRRPGSAISDLDVALDSAGFVAMHRFGGYPWTVAEYVELAGSYSWTWWAQMDLCCEPQVAGDEAEIQRRLHVTAYLLETCRRIARTWRQAGADWLQDPMPVLQGWHPAHYVESFKLANEILGGEWPALVGVGSVCRRSLRGPAGINAVLRALDEVLPRHVGVHLFGVKGQALASLATHPRVVSTDSQAWGYAARMEALATRSSCTMETKKAAMRTWYENQARPGQLPLF